MFVLYPGTRFLKKKVIQALVDTFEVCPYPFFGLILAVFDGMTSDPCDFRRKLIKLLFLWVLYCFECVFYPGTRFLKKKAIQALVDTFEVCPYPLFGSFGQKNCMFWLIKNLVHLIFSQNSVKIHWKCLPKCKAIYILQTLYKARLYSILLTVIVDS